MEGEENEQLEKIGSVNLTLRKSMAERKMGFVGHIVRKNGMEKRLMQGKTSGAGADQQRPGSRI